MRKNNKSVYSLKKAAVFLALICLMAVETSCSKGSYITYDGNYTNDTYGRTGTSRMVFKAHEDGTVTAECRIISSNYEVVSGQISYGKVTKSGNTLQVNLTDGAGWLKQKMGMLPLSNERTIYKGTLKNNATRFSGNWTSTMSDATRKQYPNAKPTQGGRFDFTLRAGDPKMMFKKVTQK